MNREDAKVNPVKKFGKDDISIEKNDIARTVVDAAFAVHREMGPGLLESIYESCLVKELQKRNVGFERQKCIPIHYAGELLDEKFRLDLLVEEKIIVEIKAVEELLPIHEAQVLTYLKLIGCEIGFLINFNVRFIKDGIRRIVLSKKH